MVNKEDSRKFSESFEDFRISVKLLKENSNAFLLTELFSFASVIMVAVSMAILVILITFLVPTLSFKPWYENIVLIISGILFTFFAILILFSFLGCQYGLAFDIMSSGDMFAEFKGSFTYFRHHWKEYTFLTVLIGWVGTLLPLDIRITAEILPLNDDTIFLIGRLFFQAAFYFLWFVLLINTLPSISAQGSLKGSFIESYRIFRKDSTRLFKTWLTYFLIFIGPTILLLLISMVLYNLINSPLVWDIIMIIRISLFTFFFLIGSPLMALIATRIYNTVEFEKYEKKEKRKKKKKRINLKVSES